MRQYVLVTESGSDLSPEIAEQYGIRVLPMYVQMDDDTYADGVISSADMLKRCAAEKIIPRTSAPNPDDFARLYREIREEQPDSVIVHIAYSAKTTCSYQNALLADNGFENIYHVDSEQVSASLGAVVIRTARYIQKNPDVEPEELVSWIKKTGKNTRFNFVIKDMSFLKAGGRCTNAEFLVAQMFGIKPLIEIKNGLLVATKRYRGNMEKVYKKVIEDFLKAGHYDPDEIYFACTPGISEETVDALKQVCHALHFDNVLSSLTGCIITCHGGPESFGIGGLLVTE